MSQRKKRVRKLLRNSGSHEMASTTIETCRVKTEAGNSFLSFQRAEKIAKGIRRRTRMPVVPFRCSFCHRWHVGCHYG